MDKIIEFIVAVIMCAMSSFYSVYMSEIEPKGKMVTQDANNLQEELLCGDFEHLGGKYSDYRELFEENWESGESEWRQIDLNGDGVEAFILQEAKPIADTGQKRIFGIFTVEEL